MVHPFILVLPLISLLCQPIHGTITTHDYYVDYSSKIGTSVNLPCGLSLTPVVNGSVEIVGQYDSLHRSRCGTTGSAVKPFRVRADVDVSMTIQVDGTMSGNTTTCSLGDITLACAAIAGGAGELCVTAEPSFSFSNSAAKALSGSFTVTMSGSMQMLLGGSVTTKINASGFPDPTLPTNMITTTHTRTWSDPDTESETFSSSTLTDGEGGCEYFYDSRNPGDVLSLSAYTGLTTLVAGPSTISLTNTSGCSNAQFDAWECYRYQDVTISGQGTTTNAQVRYRPTQFEMDLDLNVPNLTEIQDAFMGFTDSIKVGVAPKVELGGAQFKELTGIGGSVMFGAGTLYATRSAATLRNGRLTIPDFSVCHSGNMSVTGRVDLGLPLWDDLTAGYYLCPTIPNVPKCTFTPACTESFQFLGKSIYTSSSGLNVNPTLFLMSAIVGLAAFTLGH